MTPILRIGTRGSPLAVWQAHRVRHLLEQRNTRTELVTVHTTGDVILDVPLSRIGETGIFTAELDRALFDGRIDLAVHSLKDLPTVLPEGIELAAVGSREDPRDALVGRWPLGLAALANGATVATSSLRRRAQLLRVRPDLTVVEVRGNVDSRLAQLDRSREWAAIVLASAGLVRLGLANRIGERLPLDLLLPAPGQGALGVTVRAGDGPTCDAVRRALHERTTALCVAAERGFLRRLEGGCQVPVGAHAEVLSEPGGTPALRLQGRVVSLDGRRSAEGSLTLLVRDEGAAADLGARLAERVLADGGDAILTQVRAALPPSEAGAA